MLRNPLRRGAFADLLMPGYGGESESSSCDVRTSDDGATEPDSVALELMGDDVDFERVGGLNAREFLVLLLLSLDVLLDIPLQPLAEVLKQRRAARQHDVLEQWPTGI